MRSMNLLVRFLLELSALAALVFAGSRAAQHAVAITLAIAAVFAVLILANSLLLYVWRQDEADAAEPAPHQ